MKPARLLFLIAVALGVVLPIRLWVIEAIYIASPSMEPTLAVGAHLFMDRVSLRLRDPRRGEIIVFRSPVGEDIDLVKRVIAVPGDTVEIRNKQLYVNGEKLPDPHAYFSDSTIMPSGRRDNMPPTQVPEGKFFVMGDNRDRSYDSRFWGFANISDIKGKATFVYWSRDVSQGWLAMPRFDRFGHFID